MGLRQLDDDDYPTLTMGQAVELLEVQPAFLRSLDAAGVLKPQRAQTAGTDATRGANSGSQPKCASSSTKA